jgi:hypothetical protein
MVRPIGYLLAFVLTAFLPASALASIPAKGDQVSLRWRTPLIRLAVSNSIYAPSSIKADSDITGALKRSLAAWSEVADVEFALVDSDRQSISPTGHAGDGVSLITIAQTPENVMLFSRDPEAASARTRVFYNRTGTITEADIVLNPFLQFSTDGTYGTFDLESTLTHEIGHLLGIRHSGVIGSVMSESLARNSEMSGLNGPRRLSLSDIAAVRHIYGSVRAEDCCATITGRLTTTVRPSLPVVVWAEENGTGRVAAWSEAASDGSFTLGGMPGGSYSVLWQRVDERSSSPIGHLGTVKLAGEQVFTLSPRLPPASSSAAMYLIGLGSQLTDSALTLDPGREHVVFLGGEGLDSSKVQFEFNSPFISVTPDTVRRHDFGEDITVVSMVLKISPDTPSGAYSIFATSDSGIQAALTGAVIVK